MQTNLPLVSPGVHSLRRFTAKMLRITFLLFFGMMTHVCLAQAPSHDPTPIVRNSDGRYWVFTTGNGVWAMSSSNRDFTNWRAEPTPFAPGTWPSWINNYVPGFSGDFWAPGIIRMNGYYYLYYSASSFGSSRSAIGVTRASNLAGPWTDLGVVVASNGSGSAINALDAALMRDTDGRVYMSYGSWFGGLAVVEINSSTGKATGPITHIAGGNHQDREAPYIVKNGGYYYLFSNRGSCCNGLNSTYSVVVSRSNSIRGPYTNERTFIDTYNGNVVGPGHIGIGEGRLTYHYYDGNDNGNAKLMARSDFGFSNGWPYLGTPPSGGGGTVYQLRNRGTGLYLDGMGRTDNGSLCGQWANTTHPNSRWEAIDVGGGYRQLRNVGTGLYLDGLGNGENGSDLAMWANTTHHNSHWSLQQYSGNYYRLRNRGTGLYIDGMGRGANGDDCGQWTNTTHPNAQWELVPSGFNRTAGEETSDTEFATRDGSAQISVFPNPASGTVNIVLPDGDDISVLKVYDSAGRVVAESRGVTHFTRLSVSTLRMGIYILEVSSTSGIHHTRFLKVE